MASPLEVGDNKPVGSGEIWVIGWDIHGEIMRGGIHGKYWKRVYYGRNDHLYTPQATNGFSGSAQVR